MTSQNDLKSQDFLLFTELYQRAENEIKNAETDSLTRYGQDGDEMTGICIPSITQLRYAGCHISRIFSNPSLKDTELPKAIAHCKRAIYDVFDAQKTFYLAECRKFQIFYRGIIISEVIKNYNEYNQRLNAISRTNIQRDDINDEQLNKFKREVSEILEIYDIFDASRDELNKKIRQNRFSILKWLFGILAAIATSILGGCWK